MAHPHLSIPACRFGAKPEDARLAVLLVHGRTQTPADMAAWIVERIALPGVTYIAPAADGNSWYPARFMDPREANEPHLGAALARLDQLSRGLVEQGFPWRAQAVVGFSQGACLGSEFVWSRQRRYAALIAFTGGLIGPPGQVWKGDAELFEGMPVFMPNGDDDPWVPLSRTKETARVFAAHGAQVTERIYPGRPHEIRDDEIDLARAMLRAALDNQSARA